MTQRTFPRVGRRLGAVVAAFTLITLAWTGTALAQESTVPSDTTTTAEQTPAPITETNAPATPTTTSSSGAASGSGLESQCRSFAALGGPLSSPFGQFCSTIGGFSSFFPTGASSTTSVPLYPTSDYPVVYPYDGYRYPGYDGSYFDYGCGCTQSVPTSTVAATQVTSVPKGSVDTGGWGP